MGIEHDKLEAFRLRVLFVAPYLASALNNLKVVWEPRCLTMACDRYWRLYLAPKYVERCDVKEGAASLIHEIWHLLLRTAQRGDAKGVTPAEHERWNWAADLEINSMDLTYRELPEEVLRPERFKFERGLTHEQYFELLKKEANYGSYSGVGVACGDCGSAGGRRKDYELGPDGAVVTPVREEMIRRQVAESIGRMPGNMSGDLARWAKDILEPKISWREELPAMVKSAVQTVAGQQQSTWRRLSRRQTGRILRPAKCDLLPQVGFLIDTSGSMGQEDLAAGLAEVKGVLQSLQGQIRVRTYSGDVEIKSNQFVSSAEEVELVGGGGTDMAHAIAQIQTLYHQGQLIDLLIVVTDGYTPWPEEAPPEFSVVVLLTNEKCVPHWVEEHPNKKLVLVD